jgi:hypothetical protein
VHSRQVIAKEKHAGLTAEQLAEKTKEILGFQTKQQNTTGQIPLSFDKSGRFRLSKVR